MKTDNVDVVFKVLGILLNILFCDFACGSIETLRNSTTYDLDDHTTVKSNNVFPYMAAIMNKSNYLCAGALIDESWVLTVAESVFFLQESLRFIHVRLGSINLKEGGNLASVKLMEFHPYFHKQKPEYDIALIQLAGRVKLTPELYPIRIMTTIKSFIASHFIVTAWPMQHTSFENTNELVSTEAVKRQRMLQMAYMHPTTEEKCTEQLDQMDFEPSILMCLDRVLPRDPCKTDAGAPVVFNGILWGIVSSWVPEDCDLTVGFSSFVTTVAAPNISTWIYSTLHGMEWNNKLTISGMLDYDEEDDVY